MNSIPPQASSQMRIYDVIGVGFGPSNMALAIALEEQGNLDNCLFLEKHPDFLWHPGMLISGTDIQHNPLRDLVTPRNPSSPYGFLSYLKAKDRLFHYLNLAAPFPPRTEYAAYIQWVGQQFSQVVKLGTGVGSMRRLTTGSEKGLLEVKTDDGSRYLSRSISLGSGRSHLVPEMYTEIMGKDIIHLTDYLFAKERWEARLDAPRIAVVGGSQSAIEIILDMAGSFKDGKIHSISRGFGFKQKDLSAFTEQIYYPEFVDYFYDAGVEGQTQITNELWRSNYGAADPDVIADLNLKLYEQRVQGCSQIEVLHNTNILEVTPCVGRPGYILKVQDRYGGETRDIEVDGIILATGFRNFGNQASQEKHHPLLNDLIEDVVYRSDGGVDITRDYRLRTRDEAGQGPVFLNGLCEATHGFGDAGSFSILSVRSQTIADSISAHLLNSPPPMMTEAEIHTK